MAVVALAADGRSWQPLHAFSVGLIHTHTSCPVPDEHHAYHHHHHHVEWEEWEEQHESYCKYSSQDVPCLQRVPCSALPVTSCIHEVPGSEYQVHSTTYVARRRASKITRHVLHNTWQRCLLGASNPSVSANKATFEGQAVGQTP